MARREAVGTADVEVREIEGGSYEVVTSVTIAGAATREEAIEAARHLLADDHARIRYVDHLLERVRRLSPRGRWEVRTALRKKGQLTLPQQVRDTLHVKEGDDVAFEVTGPGEVLLTGLMVVPTDQAWFWTDEWQAGEREVDEHVAAGRVTTFETGEDFLAHLERLDREATERESASGA